MRISTLALFVSVNLFFVVALIYKNSLVVDMTYEKQRKEKEYAALTSSKGTLEQQLYAMQSKKEIKKFAQHKLKMKPLRLKDIKTLPA